MLSSSLAYCPHLQHTHQIIELGKIPASTLLSLEINNIEMSLRKIHFKWIYLVVLLNNHLRSWVRSFCWASLSSCRAFVIASASALFSSTASRPPSHACSPACRADIRSVGSSTISYSTGRQGRHGRGEGSTWVCVDGGGRRLYRVASHGLI